MSEKDKLDELFPDAIIEPKPGVEICDCEFAPYPPSDSDYGEESFHFLRTCKFCGKDWFGLHCKHDGVQHPCPHCKKEPKVVAETWDRHELKKVSENRYKIVG